MDSVQNTLPQSSSTDRSLLPTLLAGVLGFSFSFVLFFIAALSIPFVGDLLLEQPLFPEGSKAGISQHSMRLQTATVALTTFWWWASVSIVAVLISLYVLKLFRGQV